MNHEPKIQEIVKTLEILHPPEQNHVVEVRILGVPYKSPISGYYDANSYEKLAKDVMEYDGKAESIYVTLNPVDPALLGRANNRLIEKAKATTSDHNVIKRTLLLIDVDPERPSGISSSDEEKNKTKVVVEKIYKDLKSRRLPEATVADSGNGYHLLYDIELNNNNETTKLIERFLIAVDLMFSTEDVKIDLKVFNPARITKLYGTKACKGDPDTKDRPYRYSKIRYTPEERTTVTREKLEEIAKLAPEPEQNQYQSNHYDHGQKIDIEKKIQEYGLSVWRNIPYQGGTLYKLSECPFDQNHKNGNAYIIQFANGAVAFGCFHNTCSGKNWHSLRDKFEPGWENERKNYTKKEKSPEKERFEYGGPQIRDTLEQIQQARGVQRGSLTFQDLINNAKRYLHVTADFEYCFKVALAVSLANFSTNKPVWLQIIATSSCGKTEIIESLSGIPNSYLISNFTSKTLASGDKKAQNASLLNRIGNFGYLLFKDFTTILSLHPHDKPEIFAQLREIHDGKYSKTFGNGVEIDWNGKIGVILGCTHIIERYTKDLIALGERFLTCQITDMKDDENENNVLDMALKDKANDQEEEEKNEFKESVTQFFNTKLLDAFDKNFKFDDETKSILKTCSRFIARVRAGVVRDSYEKDYILAKPSAESPARIAKQLREILRGLLIIDNVDKPTKQHYLYLLKIAIDTVPSIRIDIITNIPIDDHINQANLGRASGYDERSKQFRRHIEDLTKLGVIERNKPKNEVEIRLTDPISNFIKMKENFEDIGKTGDASEFAENIDSDQGCPEDEPPYTKQGEVQIINDIPDVLK